MAKIQGTTHTVIRKTPWPSLGLGINDDHKGGTMGSSGNGAKQPPKGAKL